MKRLNHFFWNTLKTARNIILMPFLFIIAIACQKQDVIGPSTIKGMVSAYDANNPAISNPLEGIKILLLDVENPENITDGTTLKDVTLDSTFTNASGNYQFNNLMPGSYALYLADTNFHYNRFYFEDDLASPFIEVEATSEVFIRDFKTPEPEMDNSDGIFTVHVELVNLPDHDHHIKWRILRENYITGCFWFYYELERKESYYFPTSYSRNFGSPYNWEEDPSIAGGKNNHIRFEFYIGIPIYTRNGDFFGWRYTKASFDILDIPNTNYKRDYYYSYDWQNDEVSLTGHGD